jgi:hypothetical protein
MNVTKLYKTVMHIGPRLNHAEFRFLMVMSESCMGDGSYICDTDKIIDRCRFHWLDLGDLKSGLMCSAILSEHLLKVNISDQICEVRFTDMGRGK